MAKIKIGALGGLGENGKNLYVVEVDDKIFILDSGLKYPDIDMHGVDAVAPDMSYLISNKDKIQGIFISHGHEDNIGSLPYLLESVNIPVFGTHFTICLIEDLLLNHSLNIKKFKLYRINESKTLKFDDVTVSFFNLSHSIPETVGISINTKDGAIVYATDFNFHLNNNNRYDTSFDKLTELGKKGVLVSLVESIGTTNFGRINSDVYMEKDFRNILLKHRRTIVTVFSSLVSRIHKVIELALEDGRNIAIIGKRGQRILQIAMASNYISIPEGRLVSLKYIDDENDNNDSNLVVIVTGDRNEPNNILNRMANKSDRLIHLNNQDNVVIMAPAVPGTESYYQETINNLYEHDIDVKVFNKDVLKSTHASDFDLSLLYSMIKPKYIIPIKGEYRHLAQHKQIVDSFGLDNTSCIILDNGEFVNIDNKEIKDVDKIMVKDVYLDGSLSGVNDELINEREVIAEEGILIFNVLLDDIKKKIITEPNVLTKGYLIKDKSLSNGIVELGTRIIESYFNKPKFEKELLLKGLTNEIEKFVVKMTKQHPMIICNVTYIDHKPVMKKVQAHGAHKPKNNNFRKNNKPKNTQVKA